MLKLFVNLTSFRKVFLYICCSDNNYTMIHGLQLDMAPALGPLSVVMVTIAKNDRAEGIVQFKQPPQHGFIGWYLVHSCTIYSLSWISKRFVTMIIYLQLDLIYSRGCFHVKI